MRAKHLWVAMALCFCGAPYADQLTMDNGSLLVGTLVSADEKYVVFKMPFTDEIKIRKRDIKTIVTDAGVSLLMKDGRVYRDKRIVEQSGDLIVFSDEEQPVQLNLPDILLINPEAWRLGDGYKWSGRSSMALESERGNTATDELDMDLESIWRSVADRYTVRGNWEIDSSNGERNKYRWLVRSKYDRFSSGDPDNYYGFQVLLEHDQFADLDLRSATGPYIGRQFFEIPYLTLHAEIGVVYVEEQFESAQNNDFWGANWELHLTSEIIDDLEAYAKQTGVHNFGDSDALIVDTTIGVRFPLIYGFEASAEAVYEFDGGAVAGVDDTDETYRLKLGYKW